MSIEEDAQQTVTGSVIALYGRDIELTRPSADWTTSTTGGQIRGGVEVTLDPVRRWFQHAAGNDLQSATLEGDQSYVWGVLVGLAGDDIQKGDTFIGPDGLKYEVRYIHKTSGLYETRAEVFGYEG